MRWPANGCLFLSFYRASQKHTSDYRTGSLAKQEVQAIYGTDPRDPWNRIFYYLFTRTVDLRLYGRL